MLLGMLTGIGGGMVRDVLVGEIPTVLRAELYAVAALFGAAWSWLERAASSVFRPRMSRRSPLLRTPIYGDAARVAASDRALSRTIASGKTSRVRLSGMRRCMVLAS